LFSRFNAIASPYILLQFVFGSPFTTDEHTIDITMDGIADFHVPSWMVQSCSRVSSYLEWRTNEEITLLWTNWDPNPSIWISPPCFFRTVQTSFFRNSTLMICYQLLSFADVVWEAETLSVGVKSGNYSFSASRIALNGLCLVLSPDPARCGSYNVNIQPWLSTEVLLPVCAAGQYMTNGKSCSKCPTGTFQTATGALSMAACTSCAVGKYSTAAGASGPDSCVTDGSNFNETAACEPVAANSYALDRKGQQSKKRRAGTLITTSEYREMNIWNEEKR
jgi:hypothetical protein